MYESKNKFSFSCSYPFVFSISSLSAITLFGSKSNFCFNNGSFSKSKGISFVINFLSNDMIESNEISFNISLYSFTLCKSNLLFSDKNLYGLFNTICLFNKLVLLCL